VSGVFRQNLPTVVSRLYLRVGKTSQTRMIGGRRATNGDGERGQARKKAKKSEMVGYASKPEGRGKTPPMQESPPGLF